MSVKYRSALERLSHAVTAVVERLEERRLMAGDPTIVQTLPYALEFDSLHGGIADKDGEGTGFTFVQPGKNPAEYQSSLIDLQTASGLLNLTTTGTATAGSAWEGDNTQTNVLQTGFDGSKGSFTIVARLKGPLGFIKSPNQQGGVVFGPDQDNYIKFVAIGTSTGQYLQFVDEQKTGTNTWTHTLTGSAALTNVGSFANINTLDVELACDSVTGTVTAYYRVNGGALTQANQQITLNGTQKALFFNGMSRAGIFASQKNDLAPVTVSFDRFEIVSGTPISSRPSVTATRPANGETGVYRDGFIAADVFLPNPGKGVDSRTLDLNSVKVYRTSDRLAVLSTLNTSGGGDAIVAQPKGLLDPNTSYTFEVTSGLKDTGGAAFMPYLSTFTTGADVQNPTDPSIAFEKVTLSTASGLQYSSVAMGPDGKLYACSIDGLIQRFNVNPDGTLGAPQNITVVQTQNGGPRFLTGITFDPASTASNLIAWVSHGDYAFENATDWTGAISRISGANLENYQDYVVGLPRSVRDHTTNQTVFGPDGALYVSQSSNTAMGAPDNAWGLRTEHLLNAAVLRLNVTAVAQRIANGQGALDVRTNEAGTYNPFAANAPLTIYASGVRNAYDLVWTRAGYLYAPTNGSSAGGSTPGYPSSVFSSQRIDEGTNGPYDGTQVPALSNVTTTEDDFLFKIQQGGYYGHPNPTRGEYVLDGGNPSGGIDYEEFGQYPVGTQPDRNYRGAAYIFGKHYSPDGVIEYKGNAFNGALDGKLLVARYSGGDDIIALAPDANGNITAAQTGIAGLTHFVDPLDLTEDTRTGFIYVAEYGGQQLTLLRPITPGAHIVTSASAFYFNDVRGGASSGSQNLTITNTGTAALAIPADGFTIVGTDGTQFIITAKPTLPATVPVGGSVTVSIAYSAASTTSLGVHTATLVIKSNDPNAPTTSIALRGLATAGTGGQNEPSLQRIFDLYQLPIATGDINPANTNLFSNAEPLSSTNDELYIQRLVKAGNGPITIEPLATMAGGSPVVRFGYYDAGTPTARTELLTVAGADAQTVHPTLLGATSFDPGAKDFGLYANFPIFGNTAYSEDVLNTTENTVANRRKVRFFALKNADGSVVPNAYVFTSEDYINDLNGAYDTQDFVGIIRNVQPGAAGAEVGLENLDGVPFPDRLIFNRIQVQPPDPKTDPITGVVTQPPNNVVHDKSTFRIRNTGTNDLVINSMTLSSPAWQIVNPPAAGTAIAPGLFLDVTLQFVATSNPPHTDNQTIDAAANTGGVYNGTLTINTNDADEPDTMLQLAGWWQQRSEDGQEPLLSVMMNNIFGFGTQILGAGQSMNQGGRVSSVGEEVLSNYWQRADSNLSITVRQLDAYHTQGNTATIRWFTRGSTGTTTLFTHIGDDGQSLLPRSTATGNPPAQASFSTNNVFGFKIDGESSDDTLNVQEQPGGGYGHHVRFLPARDRSGNLIANTWLVVMDYQGINYDYQDNTYLVSNMRPANPAVPTGLVATPQPNGITLDWSDNSDRTLAGYNVYRSATATGTFVKTNTTAVTTSDFLDATAPAGTTSFYRVTARDNWGGESGVSATVSATRSADTVAPVPPTNLVASGQPGGIVLSWDVNTEADLAGYRVYRSDAAGGTYILINSGAYITGSAYTDSTTQPTVTWYYKVSAVDTAGNESGQSTMSSAARPAGAPATPASLSANADSPTQITLSWALSANASSYRVERMGPGESAFTEIKVGVSVTSYVDTGVTAGNSYTYRVRAENSGGLSGYSATASATTPQQPASNFASQDINATPAGSTTVLNPNDYDITAGGAAIYGTTDSFRYVYQQVTGNFDVKGQIISFTGGQTTATAGLMARTDLTPQSANVFSFATIADGFHFSRRSAAGGTTSYLKKGVVSYPNVWVRLTRVNNVFTGYYSTDGVTWVQTTQASQTMPSTLMLGMAVNANSTTATATVKFRGLTGFAGITPPVVNIPPAPATATASVASSSRIDVSWSASSGATSYRIERKGPGESTFTQIASGVSGTSYSDTGLAASSTYSYQVRAENSAGLSGYSPTASDTTLAAQPAPAAPGSLTATADSATQISLSWPAGANATSYRVERKGPGESSFTEIASGVTSTSFVDSGRAPNSTYSYQVRSENSAGLSTYSPVGSATTPQQAASGFSSADINATPAGDTTVVTSGSDYNVTAGGADVGGTSDGFRFVYKQVSGDFDARVHIPAMAAVDAFTKAGIMARADVSAGSANLFSLATGGDGFQFSRRSTSGGGTSSAKAGTISYPNVWVRLTRVGNLFTAYYSTDGVNWAQSGQATQAMPSALLLGMAASAHSTSSVMSVQFRDYSVTAPVAPPSDTTAPAAPNGANAVGSLTKIVTSWTANSESDLAGYNIYRSTSAAGSFTKLNGAILTGASFVDSTAPAGARSYYRITAIDTSGNESATATLNAVRPTVIPANGPALYRINVGGSAYTDSAGNNWSGDSGFSGGTVSTSAYDVKGTTDDTMYMTRRWGNMSYNLAVADGTYTLNLYMSDSVNTATGKRIFNVSAEGSPLLTNFDLVADSGGQTAVVKSFTVTVTGGQLNIAFTSIVDNAIVSGIELVAQS